MARPEIDYHLAARVLVHYQLYGSQRAAILMLIPTPSAFKTLYGWLDGNDALVLRGDRRQPLVVLELSVLVDTLTRNISIPSLQAQE